MKKFRWIILPAALVAAAVLVPASPSAADSNAFGTCPDGYTPTPFVLSPGEDRNGNGVVCVKPSPNGMNTHDDPNGKPYACNGFPSPPPECANVTAVLIGDDILP
jgi:hypothetical protein